MAFRWGSTASDWLKKGKDWVDWSTFEKSAHLAGLCTEVKNHPIGEPLPLRILPVWGKCFFEIFWLGVTCCFEKFLAGEQFFG